MTAIAVSPSPGRRDGPPVALADPPPYRHLFRAASDGSPSGRRLRVAVGLATVGRPQIARAMLARLALQTRAPDVIVVCAPSQADVAPEPGVEATVLIGPRGLTKQRNAILAAVRDSDVICFFDDDFVPHAGYLAAIEGAFLDDPGLVGATGSVLADGITGPGYSFGQADAMLASQAPGGSEAPVYNAYGCNMAFRLSAIRAARIAFDEDLPAYGWLEDVDFSRQIARLGRLTRLGRAAGIHLGVKGGRQSGLRFGYSQIANPLHLLGKGTFRLDRAAWLMSRNIAMNLMRSLRPEPHIDRRGRLAGNLLAARDLVFGRLHPTRIADLR